MTVTIIPDKMASRAKGFLMSCRFVMESNHNHSLSSADALKNLSCGDEVLEMFNWYPHPSAAVQLMLQFFQ